MHVSWHYHDQTAITHQDIEILSHRLQPLFREMEGETLLITGAAGFLLGHLVEAIAHFNETVALSPIRVLAADNYSTGSERRLAHVTHHDRIELLQIDVTEPVHVTETIHRIIHGASIASPSIYRQYPFETIWANVDGTRHLLDLAREHGVRSFLLMSSSEIYGNPAPEFIPTPESYWGHVSCTGPRACYDESKRLAETLVTTAARKYALPVKIARPFNVYGPGLRLDDQRVFPDLVRQAVSGEDLVLLSDGRPTRAFCYIQDAVAGIVSILVAGQDGEAYNVGNDEQEISMAALAELISNCACGHIREDAPAIRFARSPDADYLTDNPDRRCPDLHKIRTHCNYNPRVSLKEGIERSLFHYHARYCDDVERRSPALRIPA